jgi:hypothetical protein
MPVRKDDPRRSGVYRLFAVSRQLLYIGAALDPEKRWRELESIEWWELVDHKTVTWYDTGTEALQVETAAIKAEQPLFNLTGYRFPHKVGHFRRLEIADGTSLPVYRAFGRWLIGYGEIADYRERSRLGELERPRSRRPTLAEVRSDEEWATELAAAGYMDEAARAHRVAAQSRRRHDAAFGGPRPASKGGWEILARSCDHAEGECPGQPRSA